MLPNNEDDIDYVSNENGTDSFNNVSTNFKFQILKLNFLLAQKNIFNSSLLYL